MSFLRQLLRKAVYGKVPSRHDNKRRETALVDVELMERDNGRIALPRAPSTGSDLVWSPVWHLLKGSSPSTIDYSDWVTERDMERDGLRK